MAFAADGGAGVLQTRVGTRTVAWSIFGDPGGRAVVYFHGAGGSRLEAAILDRDAREAGLRVIAVDRPGYGRTDPLARPSVLGAVTGDVPAVLDATGVETAATCGLSAGAMYAWAAADRYPERIERVVAVSPAVPCRHPAVREAMPGQLKLVALLSRRAPGLLTRAQKRRTAGYQGPDALARAATELRKVSPVDADLLADPEVARWYISAALEGRRQGRFGVEEFDLMTSAWGFEPGESATPALVIYGASDPLAPVISAWLSASPRISARRLEGGHLQTARPGGRAEVLAALSERATAN